MGAGYTEYIAPGTSQEGAPAAPGGLMAMAVSSNRIELHWSDHSHNETLFTIERSVDGGDSFHFLDSVMAGTSHYTDTAVYANTTYYYRVRASNPFGDSAYSNIDSATTPAAVTATSLALGSISVSVKKTGNLRKHGQAVVIIQDDTGSLVQGATVSGQFSGVFTGPVMTNGPTAADGSTRFDSTQSVRSRDHVSFEFCVTAVTLDGLEPFIASPGAACGRFQEPRPYGFRQRKNRRH